MKLGFFVSLMIMLPVIMGFRRAFSRTFVPETKRALTAFDYPLLSRSFVDPPAVIRDMMEMMDQPSRLLAGTTTMPLDIKENEKEFIISVDLPGVKKEDIKVSLSEKQLVISASRGSEKEEKGETYWRIERSSGTMSRSMTLPENAADDGITAESKDGVLVVKVPKISASPPRKEALRIPVK